MSTAFGHGLVGPKIICNCFNGRIKCLSQKGIRLIFLNYLLWRFHGNVKNSVTAAEVSPRDLFSC